MDAQRALLDELMGKERNVPLPERSGRRIKFTDSDVCKHQLAGLCPNRLFKNTKSDLGPCGFDIHDDHLEWENIWADWSKLSERDKRDYGYERNLFKYLDELVREMDRKIVKAKERADAESQPKPIKPEDQIRLNDLQRRIQEALDESQILGEQGEVDRSMVAAQMADALKQQHDTLYKTLTTPDRTMAVCDVCGIFINSTDNEQRRADHLNGKQYLGWKAIREKYIEIKERTEKERDRPKSKDRDRERSPRRDDSERRRERDVRDVRERERDTRDYRERDYGRERDVRRGNEYPPPSRGERDYRGYQDDYRRGRY